MRWEALFQDLLTQMDAAEQLDVDHEIDDRSRAELVSIQLTDRLRAAQGEVITATISSELGFSGELRMVGKDWILLNTRKESILLPVGSISTLQGVGRSAHVVASKVQRSFASALRALAYRRAGVRVYLRGSDGLRQRLSGVIGRVGADHCDISTVRDGEFSGAKGVLGQQVIPFTAILAVSSLPSSDDGGL